MIPLMPTVSLAFFSFLCSAFVILRIVISILPHRSLGRRVYPLAFSSPTTHSLPPADKGYVWLALCDISAVAVFVWEAFSQWFDPSSSVSTASSVHSAARFWLALTLRQTCFFIISVLILIHVRLRRSVSFGFAHWFLWVPLVFLASVSTIAAGLFAHITPRSFLIGYIAYSCTIAILNTIMFGSLVSSLITIKRSLADFNQMRETRAPGIAAKIPHVTLSTEEIDVIREGSSWITSSVSSRREPSSHSLSREPLTPPRLQVPSLPLRGTHSSAPPQTPLPSHGDTDFGPFRHRTQSLRAAALTLSSRSQNSWIASSLGTHPTFSAWSYSTHPTPRSSPPDRAQSVVESAIASTPTRGPSPRDAPPVTVPVGGVRALASKRYAPSAPLTGKGGPSVAAAAARSPQIDISILRIITWLAGVWIPLVLSLPYLACLDSHNLQSNEFKSTFLALSVMICSPIMVLNLLLRHPIPVPHDIFDAPTTPRSILRHAYSIGSTSTSTSADRSRLGSGMKFIKGSTANGKGYSTHFPRVLAPAPRLSIFRVGDAKMPTSFVPFPQSRNWHDVQGVAPAHLPVPSDADENHHRPSFLQSATRH
ncbi:hypothetical protein BC827DRAFT_443529 [Russula dissimulans]|nr:hypothetical protein BC827DRAFT_443529 [Russula dissimulans]